MAHSKIVTNNIIPTLKEGKDGYQDVLKYKYEQFPSYSNQVRAAIKHNNDFNTFI